MKKMRGDSSTTLTPREHEVLQLVSEGGKRADIAVKFGVTPDTISHHLTSIFSKLDVASSKEAVSVAISTGLVSS
jgi:two-component system secretion system response regulator SalR